MKYVVTTIALWLCALTAFAGPDRKMKALDSYYLDSDGYVCDYDYARYEVRVYQDADSIKVFTYNMMLDHLSRVENYKTLNDSVQVKWGTQVIYDISGGLYRVENIDLGRGTQEIVQYGDSNRVSQYIFKDEVNNTSRSQSYYPGGQKKGLSVSEKGLDNVFVNTITSWFPSGQLMREQRLENGTTVMLKMFDNNGELSFALPCQDGDSVFYNADGNITSRRLAVKRGVINLEQDSIKITTFDNSGRKLAVENFMSYSPENPVSWGVQHYYYTSTPQPVDSVLVFRSINGDNLKEQTFYEDGKLKSSSSIIFNNVLVPDREFRQYYPTGVLRRVEKHHGSKLVEGHIYDAQGNEQHPFYEFVP